MKAIKNEDQNIFQYLINDHLLSHQSNQINYIQNLPSQYQLDTQKQKTVDTQKKLAEEEDEVFHTQISSNQESYQNNKIEHEPSNQMVLLKGNSNLIRSYQYSNRSRYLYEMRTQNQKQVEIKEIHQQDEKRIQQFEFQDRMLICYYWLKYVILLVLILLPILLLTLRGH